MDLKKTCIADYRVCIFEQGSVIRHYLGLTSAEMGIFKIISIETGEGRNGTLLETGPGLASDH